MPEFKICILLLCSLLMVEAQGPDPWDGEHNAARLSSSSKKEVEIVNPVNSLSDTFYKRILQLLINRGRFKLASNEILEGYLHFEFTTNEFDLLRKYSSLTVPLKPNELREIDGLLADNLIFPSVFQIYAENFIDFFVNLLKTYSIHLIFVAAFVTVYCYVDWTLVFSIRSLLIIFLFLCILWETRLQLEKSNDPVYKEISWWKFWEKDNVMVVNDIKNIYEILHPIDIVGSVLSKIIFNPMSAFMNVLDKYAEQISGKFYMPFNNLVYICITTVYFIVIIIAGCSMVFYLLFGVAVDLNFLGFRAAFRNPGPQLDRNCTQTNFHEMPKIEEKKETTVSNKKKNGKRKSKAGPSINKEID